MPAGPGWPQYHSTNCITAILHRLTDMAGESCPRCGCAIACKGNDVRLGRRPA